MTGAKPWTGYGLQVQMASQCSIFMKWLCYDV